jgi:putrescine aminotransferase
VAATITSAEVLGVLDRDPYLHTSTFSGAPLQMAAVVGAVNAMQEDNLVERARTLGLRLLLELKQIIARHFGESNVEVRGLGLMLGIKFPQPSIAGELLLALLDHDVIANHSLNANSVLRLTPPAVLDESEFDFLLSALDRASQVTAKRCSMEG